MFQFKLAGLDLGKIQNVVDQPQQRVPGGANLPHQCQWFPLDHAPFQQASQAVDGMQGGANLMAQIGHELALGLIGGFGGGLGRGQGLHVPLVIAA